MSQGKHSGVVFDCGET